MSYCIYLINLHVWNVYLRKYSPKIIIIMDGFMTTLENITYVFSKYIILCKG